MELVYLWVKRYKNIENQGFNLSPRFECNYDQDSKKLTIDKKEEHISIFSDNNNINVTAIVGENGSGKSNILKALFQNDDYSSAHDKLWYILYSKYDCKFNIYFIDHKGIHENMNIGKNFIYNIDTLKDGSNIKSKLDFSMIYFSNMLQYLPVHNDKQNKSFYNISTSYLIDRYIRKIQNDESIEFKYQYNYYKSKMIEQTIIMLKDSGLKLDFELPQSLNIVTQDTYPSDKFEIMKRLLQEENSSDFQSRVKQNIIYNFLFSYLDEIELNKRIVANDKKTIEKFYEEIKSIIPLKNELDDFLALLENPNFLMTSVKIEDIDNNFIGKLKKFNSIQALSLDILDIFHFNWKPELSSGQENYLFQFASFYDILRKSTNLKKDIIILIDEGEITMHPNWQKRYLKYYIDFLEKNFKDKNFHIILTSHSPFILSDLPKENVIFLEKDEKTGNCKNVTKDIDINTFGANIHTLLSHGFFMKNGLMGEFSKSNINEIIEFHNKIKAENTDLSELKKRYEEKKEQFWYIQKIIGEDYLKQVIKNHLIEIEKIVLGNAEAKQEEIKRLKAQIELLEQ